MQWAFTAALPMSPTGRPLKRSTSNPQLPPHAKRTAMSSVAAAAAQQPGGGSSGNGGGLPAVDVQAVAEKHGWDLQQRNDWSEDKRVVWLPVAAIRRPLQGSRSNGERIPPLLAPCRRHQNLHPPPRGCVHQARRQNVTRFPSLPF